MTAGAPEDVRVVAQLSDTHVGGAPDAAARAHRVLDHLLAMDPRPDVLLVTGDIADHGLADEYAAAREVLARWPGPLGICPGNHDVRDTFREGLLDGGATTSVLTAAGHRFVLLDSLVDAVDGVRQDHGHLPDEQLRWLDERLAEDPTPTFVCLHHPPVEIAYELMDPIMLDNADALAAVLGRHAHVVATLVGHAHSATTTTFAGRPMLVAGASVSAVTMAREPLPELWYDAPPTFALHVIHPDGRLTTHWRSLPPSPR